MPHIDFGGVLSETSRSVRDFLEPVRLILGQPLSQEKRFKLLIFKMKVEDISIQQFKNREIDVPDVDAATWIEPLQLNALEQELKSILSPEKK